MINRFLKGISFVICIVIFSLGDEYASGTYIFDAGISSNLLNNKLAGTLKFQTFGVHCSFPVGVDNTSILFGAEYGKIDKTNRVKGTEIILSEITLRYTFSFYRDLLFLTPSISLENCALHLQPSGKFDDIVIIATWENEFGVGGGCELGFRWKLFQVSIPVNVATIFTGEPAINYSGGIRFGVLFQKKRTGAH